MKITVEPIGPARAADANLPNRPFTLWGRLLPSLSDGVWTYRIEEFAVPEEDCFPDFPYDVTQAGSVFLGAYADGVCVGLAVLREDMFRYLYLDDLKVDPAYRGQGIGGRLIEACMEEARRRALQGVYVIAQDNNASACLF